MVVSTYGYLMPSVYEEPKRPIPRNAAEKVAVRIADQKPRRPVELVISHSRAVRFKFQVDGDDGREPLSPEAPYETNHRITDGTILLLEERHDPVVLLSLQDVSLPVDPSPSGISASVRRNYPNLGIISNSFDLPSLRISAEMHPAVLFD